jgi:hypothetical protein
MWSSMVSPQTNLVNERIFVRSMYRFMREPAYLSMNISYTRRLTRRHLHYLFQMYTNTMEADVRASCMTSTGSITTLSTSKPSRGKMPLRHFALIMLLFLLPRPPSLYPDLADAIDSIHYQYRLPEWAPYFHGPLSRSEAILRFKDLNRGPGSVIIRLGEPHIDIDTKGTNLTFGNPNAVTATLTANKQYTSYGLYVMASYIRSDGTDGHDIIWLSHASRHCSITLYQHDPSITRILSQLPHMSMAEFHTLIKLYCNVEVSSMSRARTRNTATRKSRQPLNNSSNSNVGNNSSNNIDNTSTRALEVFGPYGIRMTHAPPQIRGAKTNTMTVLPSPLSSLPIARSTQLNAVAAVEIAKAAAAAAATGDGGAGGRLSMPPPSFGSRKIGRRRVGGSGHSGNRRRPSSSSSSSSSSLPLSHGPRKSNRVAVRSDRQLSVDTNVAAEAIEQLQLAAFGPPPKNIVDATDPDPPKEELGSDDTDNDNENGNNDDVVIVTESSKVVSVDVLAKAALLVNTRPSPTVLPGAPPTGSIASVSNTSMTIGRPTVISNSHDNVDLAPMQTDVD